MNVENLCFDKQVNPKKKQKKPQIYVYELSVTAIPSCIEPLCAAP